MNSTESDNNEKVLRWCFRCNQFYLVEGFKCPACERRMSNNTFNKQQVDRYMALCELSKDLNTERCQRHEVKGRNE